MSAANEPLSLDQLFELKHYARVELAKRYAREKDILSWGKVVFPEKFYLPFCRPLHGYFVEIRGEPFTSTEAPRDHSKTTVKCVLIPEFQALEEPDTFWHYLNVQATEKKALDLNRGIKADFESNPVLRDIYGDLVGERWTDQQFVLRNGVVFSAIGAGQSIRGINHRQKRPDYEIIDDLYDEDDINNPDATEKKNAWFWGSCFPARAGAKRCSVHIQGTAINKSDLLEDLKGKERWKCRTFRALIDEQKGISLWPEKKPAAELIEDRRDMGSVIFNREMQNERRDDAASIIKRAWIQEYDPQELERLIALGEDADAENRSQGLILQSVVMTCDPSIGEKTENDFTAIALIYVTSQSDSEGREYWVDAVWNEHISLDQRVRLLQRIAGAQGPGREISQLRIEAIAGFKDFCAEVIRRTNLPVHEIDRVKDKISNLESKSHFFENGKVRINRNIPRELKDLLIYELTTNHPKHDDLRDAVLLGLDGGSVSTVTVF